jgi:hypothetical protein
MDTKYNLKIYLRNGGLSEFEFNNCIISNINTANRCLVVESEDGELFAFPFDNIKYFVQKRI